MRKAKRILKVNGDAPRKRGRPAGSKNKPKIGGGMKPLTVELRLDARPFNRELDEIEARITRLGDRLAGAKRRGRPALERSLG